MFHSPVAHCGLESWVVKLPERVRVEPGRQKFLVQFELKTNYRAMLVLNLMSPHHIRPPFLPMADPEGLYRKGRGEFMASTGTGLGVWGFAPQWAQGAKPLVRSQRAKPPEAYGILAIYHQILH